MILARLNFSPSTARFVRRLAGIVVSVAMLASCGGGTAQIEPFAPTRMITFGDEWSVITSDGRKYAVNGFLVDNVTRDCNSLPIWTQVVAAFYGFGFPECPVGTGAQQGLNRAAAGARATDLAGQVDVQVAAGGFTEKDLVTVLAGTNDILDLYAQFPAQNEAALIATARERGELIAQQVNRIVSLGGKVVVSTMPDVGVTPFAAAQKAAFTDTDRAAMLARLSAALNGRIRVNILNDGRFVGLVLADEMTQTAVRAPSVYGLANASTAACKADAPLPDCNALTLIAGAAPDSWLYADDRRFASGGHRGLGQLAAARARSNPF